MSFFFLKKDIKVEYLIKLVFCLVDYELSEKSTVKLVPKYKVQVGLLKVSRSRNKIVVP